MEKSNGITGKKEDFFPQFVCRTKNCESKLSFLLPTAPCNDFR